MTDLRIANWEEIADKLDGARAEMHALLAKHSPCTCTELAAITGKKINSVRPRVCELHKWGFAEPTGERKRTESGGTEHVMRYVSVEEAERRWKVADQVASETRFTLEGEG